MRLKLCFGFCLLLSAMASCAYKLTPNRVVSVQGKMIPIEASMPRNSEDIAFLEPYKQQLDREMSEQVACAGDRLEVTPQKLENKLANFAVDMIFQMVAVQQNAPVDLAMINVGGLRAPIPKGNIHLRDIYSVFPFDNKLALLKIKGKDLRKCLPAYLHKANGIANGRIEIKVNNDSAEYALFVAGKPLDDEKIYLVATIDYLAEGNDGFVGFALAQDKIIFDQTLRDAALAYVREKYARGECIDAPLEGRVTVTAANTSSDTNP